MNTTAPSTLTLIISGLGLSCNFTSKVSTTNYVDKRIKRGWDSFKKWHEKQFAFEYQSMRNTAVFGG